MESEQQRHANGDIGIAREIEENLQRERNGPGPGGIETGHSYRVIEVAVSDEPELIGANQLLYVTGENHRAAVLPFQPGGRFPVEVIEEKFFGPYDGACHQLRKERHKQGIVDIAADNRLFCAIDVNHITNALERVEADAQGKNDIERDNCRARLQQMKESLADEVRILEPAQQSKVCNQTNHQRGAALPAFPAADPDSGKVVDGDEAEQQDHKLRVPRHVEIDTAGQQQITPGGPG